MGVGATEVLSCLQRVYIHSHSEPRQGVYIEFISKPSAV
jgi:hypothetical protein